MDKFGLALGEASTWRGIVYILIALGIEISPEQQGHIVTAGLAIAGAIATFTKRPS